MAKILCISDIHFTKSDPSNVYGENFNSDLVQSIGVNKFDILFSALEEIGPIDLLIFCGDYIIGKKDSEDKKQSINTFLEFLKKVENSTSIFDKSINHTCDRILIVPGNHDVLREDNQILDEFNSKLSKYLTPAEGRGRRQKYAPVFAFDELKLLIACESTVNNSATINKEIEGISQKIDLLKGSDSIKQDIKNVLKKYSLYDIPSITEPARKEFIEINSQLEKKDEFKNFIKIMVSHHPLLVGIETSNTIKKYNNTIGGYSFMKSAMNFGYQLFIHGHIHESSCIEITDHNSDNIIPVMQIGVPMFEMDSEDYGVLLIETKNNNTWNFPFISTFLKLDSVSRRFKQTRILNSGTYKSDSFDMNHILVDREIREILEKNIIVKNGDLRNIEAASYDCALGYEYKRCKNSYCKWDEIELEQLRPSTDNPSSIEIKPHETVLIYSYEEFDIPNDMVLHASPISSWIRRGIRVDLSYFVDPGFRGKFCFPITNQNDSTIFINSRDPIVSIEFIKLSNSCEKNWRERHSEYAQRRLEFKE